VIYVLDSSAMMAFLRAEPGGDVVRGLLGDPANTCFAHVINLFEVFYLLHRRVGEPAAQSALDDLRAASVVQRDDMDAPFWQQAGRLKSQHSTAAHPLAAADCFGLALAQRTGAEFVTADHREMDPLMPLGLCPIRFIR
jgi:PIN domain nuclease of toxin-antitoxin system